MIFVDTSVWVEALRGGPRVVAAPLQALLDADSVALTAPVRVEILSGASAANFARIRRVISALPVFYPTRDTWLLVERWIARAVRSRERFGAMDLLIGAICAERGGQIWSLDDDFARLARLKLLQTYTF